MKHSNDSNTPSIENEALSKQPLPATEPTVQPEPKLEHPTKPNRIKVPVWRFLIAMLIQATLIVAVPFKSAMTYANGQTVTLKTLPVDPYDLLRGYSQTLRFEISDLEQLKQLPGAEGVFSNIGNGRNASTPIFVTLEAPKEDLAGDRTQGQIPIAWEPVAVSKDYPQNLQDHQAALQGYAQRWSVIYGLETYYMPEAQREEINEKITTEQQTEDSEFVVDVKINGEGQSVPVSLWVRDEEFRF